MFAYDLKKLNDGMQVGRWEKVWAVESDDDETDYLSWRHTIGNRDHIYIPRFRALKGLENIRHWSYWNLTLDKEFFMNQSRVFPGRESEMREVIELYMQYAYPKLLEVTGEHHPINYSDYGLKGPNTKWTASSETDTIKVDEHGRTVDRTRIILTSFGNVKIPVQPYMRRVDPTGPTAEYAVNKAMNKD